MNEQLLKDLVATAKQDGYDWDIITGKFPELADYDTQLLKDYVATAEQDKYDYEKINAKFSEFDFSAKTGAVVGEGATTPAGTDSASEGGSLESQEKDTLIERTFGKNEFTDFFGDIYRAGQQGYLQSESVGSAINLMSGGKDSSEENILEFVKANQKIAKESMESDEMKDFNRVFDENDGGAFGFLMGVLESPSILPSLFVSSMATQVGSLRSKEVAGAAAAGAGTGAALGLGGGILAPLTSGGGAMIGGFAAGAAAMEAGLTFSELIQEEIDGEITADKVKSILQNPEKLSDLTRKAVGRGVAIGAIEGLTAGLAKGATGAALRTVKKGKTLASRSVRKAASVVPGGAIEIVGGGLGEVAGRLAADQEMDVKEIGFEMFAGLGSAPVTTIGPAVANMKTVSGRINSNKIAKKGGYKNVSSVFSDNNIDETTVELAASKNTSNLVDEQVEIEVANGRMTQDESNAIKENFRSTQGAVNTANKIDRLTSENKPEAVKLLIEEAKLKDKIKDVDNASLTKTESVRLKEVQASLENIGNPSEVIVDEEVIIKPEKYTTPTEGRFGSINRADNKGVVNLSESEFNEEIAKFEESKKETTGKANLETETETIEQPATDVPSDGQNNGKKVEKLRAEEQVELLEAIPNAKDYLTDGKVDGKKITNPEDIVKFNEIYDRYNEKISPLLEVTTTDKSSEVETKPLEPTVDEYQKSLDILEPLADEYSDLTVNQLQEVYEALGENSENVIDISKKQNAQALYVDLSNKKEALESSAQDIAPKVQEEVDAMEADENLDMSGIDAATPEFKRKTVGTLTESQNTEQDIKEVEILEILNKRADSVIDVSEIKETEDKPSQIDVKELNKRTGGDFKEFDINTLDGVGVIWNISDQLTTGNYDPSVTDIKQNYYVTNPLTGNKITNLKGGMGFSSVKGHEGIAWASINSSKVKGQQDAALNAYNKNPDKYNKLWADGILPDGHIPMIIVKMGNDSIFSNEAMMRVIADNLSSFPKKNKKAALESLKEKLEASRKDLKEKVDTGLGVKNKEGKRKKLSKLSIVNFGKFMREIEDVQRMIKDTKPKSIEDVLSTKNLKSLNSIASVVQITKLITSGNFNVLKKEPSKSKKPILISLYGKNPSQQDINKFNIKKITDVITEPELKNVPQRSAFMVTAIDIKNPGIVKTNHPNYPVGPKGKVLGVLKQPISIVDLVPSAYNNVALGIAKEVAGKKPSLSDEQRLTQTIPVQAGLANKELLGTPIGVNTDRRFIDFIQRSFPDTNIIIDTDTFNSVMQRDGVKEYLKDGDVVYGVTVKGEIFINPEVHNTSSDLFNTSIHEMGHVWTKYIQQTPKGKILYNKGIALVKETDTYREQLKIFDGDVIKASEEAMAILIGNKGESITNQSIESKWGDWLIGLWDYVKSQFKQFKNLKIEEIQELNLQEFLGTALSDILGGNPIKLTEKQIEAMKSDAEFSKSSLLDEVNDIIKQARGLAYTEAAIEVFLKKKGVDSSIIASALSDKSKQEVKKIKEKATSIASETQGLSVTERFKQGFAEFVDAVKNDKRKAREVSAQKLRDEIAKVKESFRARIKQGKDARADVITEIKVIIEESKLKKVSNRTVNKIMKSVNEANATNMQKKISDVMDAISRDIDRRAMNARIKTLKLAKSKLSRLADLKELEVPVLSVLKINPKQLSKEALRKYDEIIINLSGVETKYSVDNRKVIKKLADAVVESFNKDNDKAEIIAETINQNLDLSKTKTENLKQMLKDGLITDSDFEIITRFNNLIGKSVKEELTIEELEEKAAEKRAAAVEDFEVAVEEAPKFLENLSQDDKAALKFAKSLKVGDLEMLSTSKINILTRGVEMLQAGFVTTNLVQSKLFVEANRNEQAIPLSEIKESGVVDKSISSAKMSVINMFKGRDKLITSIRNRLNSTPLKNIDQVLSAGAKKFKSTMIYENVFRPVSIAFASAEQMMLDINADLKKANSILDISVNKRWVQKAKIMIYQIQREFESNPDNPEVNPAIKWIKATINDPNNLLSDREIEALEKIMKQFSVNGEIDSKKMFDSFTDKEKKHLKIVDNVYKKIQPMVIADAKMQGKAFVLRKNYVHLPKVAKNDTSMSNNLDELANSFKNPALKNKAATQRTGKVHAISFDPVFNANAISKKVVISYYMYPTIKTAKITLNGLKRKANTKFEKELTLALEDIFDGIVRSKYSHLSRNRSFITKALAFLGKSGYLAQLAGPVKAAVELTTNITHAVFTDPASFMSGMKELQSVPREIMDAAFKVIPTTQGARVGGEPGLSGKDVDNNLINSSENIFKQEEMTSEFMDKAKTLLGFAKVPTSAIIKFNEGLISKPDTMVARPLFVGAFSKSFESMTGEKPNWNKIANDQSYRDKFAEAIDQAAADGDTAVIDNAASNNPFDSIPRNVLDKDADAIKQAVQMINGYMTRFRTFEYFSAVKAVQGLMGKGNITQAQGAMLLTGTVVRLSMYKMGIDMVFALIFSMLGIDEEDDDLDLDKDITRNVLGAVVTLALGRSMGNISQMPVNFGTEWLNKEYGEGITREGEYNAYKDGVVFSKIPMELKPQDNMIEKILVSSLGSYTPVVKTIVRGGKLATRSVTSKQESTREKNLGELSERIPFEIAGNLGVVPGYKTLRKIYLKHLFNGVKNSKKEESSSGSSKSSYRSRSRSRSRSSSRSRSRSRSSSRSRSRSGK